MQLRNKLLVKHMGGPVDLFRSYDGSERCSPCGRREAARHPRLQRAKVAGKSSTAAIVQETARAFSGIREAHSKPSRASKR